MNKKEWRKKCSDHRLAMLPAERQQKNEAATKRLLDCQQYQKASHIFLFLSFEDEINTMDIVADALSKNKCIYVPITERGNPTMRISRLKSLSDLEPGHFGILTPKKEALAITDPEILDLIIVPGLAFDACGYRIGYGGGFYDRFFSELSTRPFKLGFAYDFQFVQEVPHDELDQPVDAVLTDKRWIEINPCPDPSNVI